MIAGTVNDRYEPMVDLVVLGPDGQRREVQAVVDTGYNGFLQLPQPVIEELHLPYLNSTVAALANDQQVTLHTHQATVMWDGEPRTVRATASGSTPLVGMAMMDGSCLLVEVRPQGALRIETGADQV